MTLKPQLYRSWLLCTVLCALMAGCASMGLVQPKTLSERISYAYGTTTGIRITASNALTAKQIELKDAQYILEVTDQSRTLLDAAQLALSGGDASTAEGRLVLAIGILDRLSAYLSQKVKT